MPSKPFEAILYRELSIVAAKNEIEIAHQLLQEIVNYSTNVIVRCAVSSDSDIDVDLALQSLYRQIIELTDAIDVLISSACVDPVVPLLRSSFESLISMEYILADEEKYVQRSFAWMMHYFHDRLTSYKMLDPTAQKGKEFLASISADKHSSGFVLPYKTEEIKKVITNLESIFSDQRFRTIVDDYSKLKKKKWYALYGGPTNIKELAYKVGRNVTYDWMYRLWSRFSHAHDFSGSVVKGSADGTAAIAPLRNTKDLRTTVSLAAMMLLEATRIFLLKFRSGEDYRTWYMRDVQSLYLHFVSKPE